MSPRVRGLLAHAYGFPRVSGDEPTERQNNDPPDQFSPRERG